jgi:hypothetical protein
MGSGVGLLDFDGDGNLDLYFVNAGDPPVGSRGNRLFRQEPDGRFSDVTETSGSGDTGYGMGVAVGDVDNDGDVDLYLSNYGEDRLLRNRGDGTFADATAAAGIKVGGWSSSAAFFDYDLDGFLDLYVTRYVLFDPEIDCHDPAGRPEFCGPKEFPPARDVLLHNNGDGTFTDVSRESGIGSVAAASLGVVCEDWNGDRLPDVFVANDAYANHLWINRGDGTFSDDAMLMGVAYNAQGEPEAGMGVIADDLDGDTLPDLFLTHLRFETNTHYRNLGSTAGFRDVTGETGLGPSSRAFTGFGTVALDVELDGDLDLAVVNGRVNRSDPAPEARVGPPWNMYAEPNLFYVRNLAGVFESTVDPVRELVEPVEVSRGLAVGDLDNDGDMDLVVTNTEGAARLLRNDVPRAGRWLLVHAIDPRLGRDAIGAHVTLTVGDRRMARTIRRAYSYLSSSDVRAHFGLGDVDRVDRIEVLWPDGRSESYSNPSIDQELRLVRGTGTEIP